MCWPSLVQLCYYYKIQYLLAPNVILIQNIELPTSFVAAWPLRRRRLSAITFHRECQLWKKYLVFHNNLSSVISRCDVELLPHVPNSSQACYLCYRCAPLLSSLLVACHIRGKQCHNSIWRQGARHNNWVSIETLTYLIFTPLYLPFADRRQVGGRWSIYWLCLDVDHVDMWGDVENPPNIYDHQVLASHTVATAPDTQHDDEMMTLIRIYCR